MSSTVRGLTRFARSFVHQNVVDTSERIRLRVVVDGSWAAVSTDRADADSLLAAVESAVAAARVRRPDAAFPGLAPPAPLAGAGNWDDATADATPDQRAAVVREFVAAADGLETAGYVESMRTESVYANTAGQSVAGRVTGAAADGIARVPGADGVARLGSVRLGDLGGAGLGRIAAAKARAGADAGRPAAGRLRGRAGAGLRGRHPALPARARVQRPAGGRGAVVRPARRAAVRRRAADLGRTAGRAVDRAAVRRRGHAAAAARPRRGRRQRRGRARPADRGRGRGELDRARHRGRRAVGGGAGPAAGRRRRRRVIGRPGRADGAGAAGQRLLVHPDPRPAHGRDHRADPQRGLADRERRDRGAGQHTAVHPVVPERARARRRSSASARTPARSRSAGRASWSTRRACTWPAGTSPAAPPADKRLRSAL